MKHFLKFFIGPMCILTLFVMMSGTAFAAETVHTKPARALVTCFQNGCGDQDPVATGCVNGAYTVSHADIHNNDDPNQPVIGVVNLRYSPTCGTNWTQVLDYRTPGTDSNGRPAFLASIARQGGADGDGYFISIGCVWCGNDGVFGSNYAYTYMIWAPDVNASASGYILGNLDGTKGSGCAYQSSSFIDC